MKLKFSSGLLLLISCTVIAWLCLGETKVKESVAPREPKLRVYQPREIRSGPRTSHSAGPGGQPLNTTPAQASAPDFPDRSVEKITPLETWSNRPAVRTRKQKEPAGQPARPNGGSRPVAIRLSNDFQLPASILAAAAHQAESATKTIPAPIEAVSENLITSFYQSLAGESSLDDGSEPVVEIDPGTGELTRVIESNVTTDRIRKQSDELYRSLFGDQAYDQFLRQSAIERTLPVADSSLSTD